MEENLFHYLTAVPVLGIFAQWIAWRFRLPSILLLLVFGVALGSVCNIDEVIRGFSTPDYPLETTNTLTDQDSETPLGKSHPRIAEMILFPLVSLSVAIIMFEGGLSLRLGELESAGRTVLQLVTIGTIVTFSLAFLAAWLILDLHPKIAALLGGVLVVTGPTVVIPLLRHIRPNQKIGSIIKWEGIVIDPIGAIMTVLIFEQLFVGIKHEHTFSQSILALAQTILIGAGFGWFAAQILIQLVKHYLIPDFLHGVFFLATALLVFAVSNFLREESGLVTVTLMGIVLANQKTISIDHVFHFKENLRVFLISCLFIVLGSRIDIRAIMDLGWQGLVFLSVLITVVRPVSVFLSTFGTQTTKNERFFLAFLAPRGIVAAAVSSVFALKIVTLLSADGSHAELVNDAEKIVPVTFLVIFGTVLVYGLAATPLARYLELDDSDPQGILFAGADGWICEIALAIKDAGFSVFLVDTNYRKISEAKMKGLDADCISILSEQFIEENDFSGIGRLAAATRSDQVNALATLEFSEIFGRSNVYQLCLLKKGHRSSLGDNVKARTLFQNELNYDHIHELYDLGWKVKSTKITEEFPYDHFLDLYGGQCHVLFIVDGGKLQIVEAEKKLDPKPGQILISLVWTKPKNHS
ncbi:MAG: sodium:proton antiporter [Planctomycetota bacterium]|nr:sodium:proton antiporter [Planctomycetota bacterium]